jgi:hypothetical protein
MTTFPRSIPKSIKVVGSNNALSIQGMIHGTFLESDLPARASNRGYQSHLENAGE